MPPCVTGACSRRRRSISSSPVTGIPAYAERVPPPGGNRHRQHGVHVRNEHLAGVGGKQVIQNDPSGKPIELSQPTLPEAALN
jgi:hypothetical protein